MTWRSAYPLVCTWLVLTLAYGVLTVMAKMALPPTGDLYAHTVGFQTVSFVVFKLPALIVLLVVLLAVQFFVRSARAAYLGPSARLLLWGTFWTGIALALGAGLQYLVSAEVPRNPWFQYREQFILSFIALRLPAIALVIGLLLAAELWWLKSKGQPTTP